MALTRTLWARSGALENCRCSAFGGAGASKLGIVTSCSPFVLPLERRLASPCAFPSRSRSKIYGLIFLYKWGSDKGLDYVVDADYASRGIFFAKQCVVRSRWRLQREHDVGLLLVENALKRTMAE